MKQEKTTCGVIDSIVVDLQKQLSTMDEQAKRLIASGENNEDKWRSIAQKHGAIRQELFDLTGHAG